MKGTVQGFCLNPDDPDGPTIAAATRGGCPQVYCTTGGFRDPKRLSGGGSTGLRPVMETGPDIQYAKDGCDPDAADFTPTKHPQVTPPQDKEITPPPGTTVIDPPPEPPQQCPAGQVRTGGVCGTPPQGSGVPQARIDPTAAVVDEGRTATFTVELDAAAADDVDVAVNVEAVLDSNNVYIGDVHKVAQGQRGTRTVTIPDGKDRAWLLVGTVDDSVPNASGFYQMSVLDDVPAATAAWAPTAPRDATLTVVDDDQASAVLSYKAIDPKAECNGYSFVVAPASRKAVTAAIKGIPQGGNVGDPLAARAARLVDERPA